MTMASLLSTSWHVLANFRFATVNIFLLLMLAGTGDLSIRVTGFPVSFFVALLCFFIAAPNQRMDPLAQQTTPDPQAPV